MTAAEVSQVFDLVRSGSTITGYTFVDQLNREIQTIAEREGVTKGAVLVKVRDASCVTLLHVAAQHGREGMKPFFPSLPIFNLRDFIIS